MMTLAARAALYARRWYQRCFARPAAPTSTNGEGIQLTREQAAHAEANAAVQRLNLLADASMLLNASLDYETTLQRVAHAAVPLFADYCCVDVMEVDGSVYRAAVAHVDRAREPALRRARTEHPSQTDSGLGLANVIRTGEPYVKLVVDATGLAELAGTPSRLVILQTLDPRSYIAMPLIARGQVLGGMALVLSESGRQFSTADVTFAQDLAQRCALAIDNARLYRNLQSELAERQHAERENGRLLALAATQRTEARFRALIQHATDVITVYAPGGLVTYQSPSIERVFGYAADATPGLDLLTVALPEDAQRVRDFLHEATARRQQESVSLEWRLRHKDGTLRDVEGVAINLLDEPDVDGIVLTVRDITERKVLEDQLVRQAFHDGLTGLANRALFLDRVTQALLNAARRGSHIAVLYLDLDNFKRVNDSLGHAIGDQLLVSVGQCIGDCVRQADTVARFGGDEFAMLLEDVDDDSQALDVANRIAEMLRQPLMLDGREVFASFSIGIALSSSAAATTEAVLRNADLALYRAKAEGRARYVLFDPSMQAVAIERMELETDLRYAVARNELRVYFQPIVDLKTGLVNEVEALARWERPGHGLVSPLEFIPVAEETGLIVPIGQWVLEEACRWAKHWGTHSAERQPVAVSVNLSARQFEHPHLLTDIQRALTETGLDPHQLKLEITESVVMRDPEATIATLEALQSLGIRVAVDDFGTGYSSLAYLKRLPVETLKIDRSFVSGLGRDVKDAAIVDSVVALARTLNLSVTAEGIETAAQASHLQLLGCERGQGFLYAKPLPPEEIERLFDNSRPASARFLAA